MNHAPRLCYIISTIYSNLMYSPLLTLVLSFSMASLPAPGHSLRLGRVACAQRPNYTTSRPLLYSSLWQVIVQAGLECSEDPSLRAHSRTHTRTLQRIEKMWRMSSVRCGTARIPTLPSRREILPLSLPLSRFTIASPFLSHNPHSYLEHFMSFLFCCVFRGLLSASRTGMKFTHN